MRIRRIIFGLLLLSLIGGIWFVYTPKDIRPAYLQGEITEKDYQAGKTLLAEMQAAYGGKDQWLAHQTGTYAQEADWYEDKFGRAGWDTLPQQFQMTSILGTDDCEFTLLNGKNKGQTWGVTDWNSYQKKEDGTKQFIENEKYEHKLIYKNYWFQLPFRISEAPIIAYGGEATAYGKTYDLLYATWGSEAANSQYDQYLMYIDQETRMIEWLQFTLRENFVFVQITAQFTDFKKVNGITCPFSQYITFGKTGEDNPKVHENRYQWIQFGMEKVMR